MSLCRTSLVICSIDWVHVRLVFVMIISNLVKLCCFIILEHSFLLCAINRGGIKQMGKTNYINLSHFLSKHADVLNSFKLSEG